MTDPKSHSLAPTDFADFFEGVHDHPPFPWQSRLAARVCSEGWPETLDVPTSAGKTSSIDVAVFHLALQISQQSARQGGALEGHLRICFVVDRRLVVDDAFTHAQKLARRLRLALPTENGGVSPATSPTQQVVRRVAEALRRFAEPGAPPLRVARLRGGVPLDSDWARTPRQPTVITSTVDQVGSRYFFRGYGVSSSMRPVHAGLLGADTLFLLDEAHLSQPFVQSLKCSRIFQDRGPFSDDACPSAFGVVSLSATPVASPSESTGGSSQPRLIEQDDYDHDELGPRLTRSKLAELHLVKAKSDQDGFTRAFADAAWELGANNGGGQVIAVVVNRVHRARAIFEDLQERVRAQTAPHLELALLTGRTRELDRERMLEDLLPRMKRPREATGRGLIIVATQCVEAGADLDFDALITELAPLDCLRQRFGRLNRRGKLPEAPARILAASDQIKVKGEEDPVYGSAMAQTWAVLDAAAVGPKPAAPTKKRSGIKSVDLGIQQASAWLPTGAALATCLAPRSEAPVLLPAFIRSWSWTSLAPAAEPEVAFFLHGPDAGPPDVQVVWRADLVAHSERELWRERVACCPPVATEAIALPRGHVVRWLNRSSANRDLVDVEGRPDPAEEEPATRSTRAFVVRWCGSVESSKIIPADEVSPGDLIVVPAELGGCDGWGWHPDSEAPVEDLAREALLRQRNLDVLRLSPDLFRQSWLAEKQPPPAESASKAERQALEIEAAKRERAFRALLAEFADMKASEVVQRLRAFPHVPGSWRASLEVDGPDWHAHRASDGRLLALSRRGARKGRIEDSEGEATTETDRSSLGTQRQILLTQHSSGVRSTAEHFARGLLPACVAADVALAAYLHDAGKAHAAFKRWLYGGDELAELLGPPLAKSDKVKFGKRSRELAGLPDGARHEVASLAFARHHSEFAGANDPELVLWLIGTHHGWGRPFFPPVKWPAEGDTISFDLGDGEVVCTAKPFDEMQAEWFEIQRRVTKRYGVWGLARLESILRLADHRRSEWEQSVEAGHE